MVKLSFRPASLFTTIMFLFITSLLTGCSYAISQPTSTYVHFVPRTGSLFKLEFDYPANLQLQGDKPDFQVISIVDPSDPTTAPGFHPELGKGTIYLDVQEIDPNHFVDTEVNRFLETTRAVPQMTITDDREITIDGYMAREITRKIAPRPALEQLEAIISQTVFLKAKDRYYQIGLGIAERDQGGPMAQAFEHLLASIRVLP